MVVWWLCVRAWVCVVAVCVGVCGDCVCGRGCVCWLCGVLYLRMSGWVVVLFLLMLLCVCVFLRVWPLCLSVCGCVRVRGCVRVYLWLCCCCECVLVVCGFMRLWNMCVVVIFVCEYVVVYMSVDIPCVCVVVYLL